MAKKVVHPGEVIRAECLLPLKMTVGAAAAHLGVSRKALSELLNGQTGLTVDMAMRVSKAFCRGKTEDDVLAMADMLLAMQRAFDNRVWAQQLAQQLRQAAARIQVRRISEPATA